MSEYSAIVAGHICLDVIPSFASIPQFSFERMFVPGRLLQVGPASFSTGGLVSNTGLALNKLGIRTLLIGKVGDDFFGQAIRQLIRSYDVRLADGLLVDNRVHTSYSVIISPPGVDRLFLHYSGANDTFRADDVRYDLVAQTRLFHFGYPPAMKLMFENDGAQLVEIFHRAKATGVTASLDMSLPDPFSASGRANWIAILKSALPYVDIFLPSVEEILFMLRRETYDELFRRTQGSNFLRQVSPRLLSDLGDELLALGAKIVGIKVGERGLYLRTGSLAALEMLGRARPSSPAAWANKELWAPCFKVNVVGTTGSGDATIAGFLSALLRDLPPEAAITTAVAVGASNVEAADALSGIGSWDDTQWRIANSWARCSLPIDAPGWQFSESQQLWIGPHDVPA